MSSVTPGPGASTEDGSAPAHDQPGGHNAAESQKFGRDAVVGREKSVYGGMKFGAGFFGWIAATGMVVLLTTLVGGAGAALGLQTGLEAPDPASGETQTAGLVGGIVLLAILLISYFCGGYVAGRMARFSGIKQGLAVWLWALIAVAVAVGIGLLAGKQFDVVARLNGLPQLPVDARTLTTAGLISVAVILVVSLIGALLGGLTGMRYHRKIDRIGLEA